MGSSITAQTVSSTALATASRSLKGTKTKPGSRGSKPCQNLDWPVAESAPRVRPWKEFSMQMIRCRPAPKRSRE